MNYDPVQPPFSLRFGEMSKEELHDYYRWYLEQIPTRVEILESAVKATAGFESWTADAEADSLIPLGAWFFDQVELRNRTPKEQMDIQSQASFPIDASEYELTDKTFSIAVDVGMYLGMTLLKQDPSLRWEQDLSRREFVDYGQPVLAGDGPVALNPTRIAITMAYGFARGTKTGYRLFELFEHWSRRLHGEVAKQ